MGEIFHKERAGVKIIKKKFKDDENCGGDFSFFDYPMFPSFDNSTPLSSY